jgi:hypothetical protein
MSEGGSYRISRVARQAAFSDPSIGTAAREEHDRVSFRNPDPRPRWNRSSPDCHTGRVGACEFNEAKVQEQPVRRRPMRPELPRATLPAV